MNKDFHSHGRIQQDECGLSSKRAFTPEDTEVTHYVRYKMGNMMVVIPLIRSILELSNSETQKEEEGLPGTVGRRK